MARNCCGETRGPLVCDKPPGHAGDHRGYLSAVDEVLFWPTNAAILDELEHRIRVALAKVDEADRAAAAQRLTAAILDAIGAARA